MNPQNLFLVAAAAKEAIIAHYAAQGADLPARRLVTPGLPAWDCAGLFIQAETLAAIAGDPTLAQLSATEIGPAFDMRAVTLGITVARCVPLTETGEAPLTEWEEASALDVYADAGHVWNAIHDAVEAGDLPCCGAVAFLTWTSLGPEGGLVGGLTRVAVSLE